MSDLSAHFPIIESAPSSGTDVFAWLTENRERLTAVVEQSGAILLRGFDLATDKDFDSAIGQFELPVFTYEESLSNAVRKNRTDKVFTANEAPPEIEIFLHHEMAQTPKYPSKLFFFCEQAAAEGGATPLCRSDSLLAEMKQQLPQFVEKCAEAGLKYTNVMPEVADAASGQGRSWKSTLSCATRGEAEARLTTLGYSWQWQDDGSLRVTTPVLPAIRQLASGKQVFFNQLIAASRGWSDTRNIAAKSVRFGDDSEISSADMQQVADMAEAITYNLCWQNGDMALVDNFLVMHGRRPFQGERRVLASLVA